MNTQTTVCQCGCGRQTNKIARSEPRRYIRGHNRRGAGAGWLEQGWWYISIDGKKKAFHRQLVEQRDGRTLNPNEVVHHIDHDPLDNHLGNLAVLSRSEHMRLHRLIDKSKRWTEGEKNRARELREAGSAWALGRSYSGTRDQLAKLHPSMSRAQRPSRAVPQGARVPVTARARRPATEPRSL
jgi:hypothetical protein